MCTFESDKNSSLITYGIHEEYQPAFNKKLSNLTLPTESKSINQEYVNFIVDKE